MTLFALVAWIVQSTAKGSVAIAVMAVAHLLIGRRLRARWWCALWLLALVRLIAPVTPASVWSLFNMIPPHPGIDLQLRGPAGQIVFDSIRQTIKVPWWIAAWRWLAFGWAIGFAVILTRIAIATVRMQSLVRRAFDGGGATTAAWHIVEEARAQLHIRREIVVLESPLIDGPALHGVFRPTLLLPEGMCSAFDEEELRHVILHELAHLGRHDVAVNWLLNVVRAVHWFNPVVWLAVAGIQEERELACDELTLSCLRPNERLGYGRTILKLVERFRSAEPVPALVGIVNQKQQMRRRLIMISEDERRSPLMLPILAVLSAIGFMALADAPRTSRTLDPAAVQTLQRFNQRIDVDLTDASLPQLLSVVAARSGVNIAQSSSVADLAVQRARFTVHAVDTPAASVLASALMPYGVVALPDAKSMTLTTGPPCLVRRSNAHR